jgi:tRNA threonylcarbamoyladenosine biosynthesis protein TsaB
MADQEPNLLLIETSGSVGRVGLAVGSTLLSERALDATRRHARDLVPAVSELLDKLGWQPRDINAIALSTGPGSYTGLRVGIMSAKALAYATGCAVIAVPTFDVIANQTSLPGCELDVIADAQQEKIYLQRFSRAGANVENVPTSELAVVAGREWARTRSPEISVAGPGLRVAAAWLPSTTPTVTPECREPTVLALLAVALQRRERGLSDDALQLEPIYLRPSSAEEQWNRRG